MSVRQLTPLDVYEDLHNFRKPEGVDFMVGGYMDELVDAFIASLISNSHLYVCSPPGYGKTSVALAIARAYGNHRIVQITPQMDDSPFIGILSIRDRLQDKNSMVLDGTPFDPTMDVFIADELPRANAPTLQALIHATDELKQDTCLVWATANTQMEGEALTALVDRFGVMCFISPSSPAVEEVLAAYMMSGGRPKVAQWFPTKEQVKAIRSAKPTAQSIAAMQSVILYLTSGIAAESALGVTSVNNRHIGRLGRILYYASVLFTGTNDFSECPPEAVKYLRYAYPAMSQTEYDIWSGMVDKMAAMSGKSTWGIKILRLKDAFAQKCREIVQNHPDSQTVRSQKQVELRPWWDAEANNLRQKEGSNASASDLNDLANARKWMSNVLVQVIQGDMALLEEALQGHGTR